MAARSLAGAGRKKRCVLSIDGGGVRGLIPAQILECLEQCLQDLDGKDARIADYFDIVAGTSTGGLVAVMLTTPDENGRPKFTAKQVTEFYLKYAKDIFPQRSALPGFFSSIEAALSGPKYSPTALENILKKEIGDKTLVDTVAPVLVPTYDVKLQQPVIFTTSEAKCDSCKNALLRNIARGTSAAPTYFPPIIFETTKGVEFNLVDGGLAANNPTFLAIVDTLRRQRMESTPPMTPRTFSECFKDLLVISLGCGNRTTSYTGNEVGGWGALSWVRNGDGTPITDMLFNASSDIVDYTISSMYGLGVSKDRYLRIQTSSLNSSTASVDNSSTANVQELVKIGQKMLKETVQTVNFETGAYEPVASGETNEQAIKRFAAWLSQGRTA